MSRDWTKFNTQVRAKKVRRTIKVKDSFKLPRSTKVLTCLQGRFTLEKSSSKKLVLGEGAQLALKDHNKPLCPSTVQINKNGDKVYEKEVDVEEETYKKTVQKVVASSNLAPKYQSTGSENLVSGCSKKIENRNVKIISQKLRISAPSIVKDTCQEKNEESPTFMIENKNERKIISPSRNIFPKNKQVEPFLLPNITLKPIEEVLNLTIGMSSHKKLVDTKPPILTITNRQTPKALVSMKASQVSSITSKNLSLITKSGCSYLTPSALNLQRRLPMESSIKIFAAQKKKSILKSIKKTISRRKTPRTSSSRIKTGDKAREQQTVEYLNRLKKYFIDLKDEAERRIVSIPMRGCDFEKRQKRQRLRTKTSR